ncbi:MAG: GNAT family N-acetyltransferase [Rivularia sp. ALOHA_DT_140]|nr:GNAT family N-acetyltransferase [Rivularia sp. ALOHA_DT_140]
MTKINIKAVNWEDFPVIKEIRKQVFQQEQGVDIKLDFDGQDENCQQLIAYLDKVAVGTARIRYLDNNTAKIERLAVLPSGRGQGIAKKIMESALELISKDNIPEVKVNAQEYIKGLYQQLGFVQIGEVFQEAGIPHLTSCT